MSATNRGAVRAIADYYPTPQWCARRGLEALGAPVGLTYLEPCAGEGALTRAIRAHDPSAVIVALELRPEATVHIEGANAVVPCDALSVEWPPADVVFMNPPFSRAIEFTRKALDGGYPIVMVLERLCWLCTWGKADASRMPAVYVLPDRPSFTGAGRTDASEYAWFVWGAGERVAMLPRTPLEVRRAG